MKQNKASAFRLQHDQSDCGVACLRNILAYYRADISVEKLREWSGASQQGTSLLGLHNAASQAGFKAEGARAGSIEDLFSVEHPCILHVTIDGIGLHYVVYYGQNDGRFRIGDPAKGIVDWTWDELDRLWTGRTLLLLTPGEKLAQWQQQRKKKLQWIWRTLQEDLPLLYAALGLGIACAGLNLSTAIFSQRLLDHILPSQQKKDLVIGLALLGLLLVMKAVFSFIRQHFLIKQGFALNMRITGGFFKSVLLLPKSFFDHRKTGDLIARLNDTQRIQQAAAYILGEMTIQVLMMFVTLGFLFYYYWPIAIFCLVMAPVIYAIVRRFEGDIILGQRSVMLAHAHNESNYVDTIRGVHTVKVMNRETLFTGIAANFFLSLQTSVMQLGKIKIRFNVLLEISTALFLLTIIGWAATVTWHGSLHTGQMIAILQLAGMLMQTIILVALTNLQVQEAAVALDRMYEFTMLEPEHSTVAAEEAPVSFQFDQLSISHIGFRWPGRRLLLKDISLELRRGEVIALSGESGQGKSTLLQVLQKFYGYEGGPLLVNGRDLDSIDTVSWRKVIGVVPQDIAVFSGTLLANICLDPGTEHIDQVQRFCREYGFDKYFEALPQSYATVLGEGGVALSGGQRQLLALVRCLYHRPQLLLLDEPTAAMDAHTEQFVVRVLERYKKEAGVLIISHKDSLTLMADRVYHIEQGCSCELSRNFSYGKDTSLHHPAHLDRQ